MPIDRLKANGVKFSLTRRRESAKWKEAGLFRVFVFDSEIPQAARPAGRKRKNAKRKKTRKSLFFCVFAASREALFLLTYSAFQLHAT
jgi:hypothetical protein